jgi:hypothetical protein
MHCPLVYEVNTRCWLKELLERSGRPVTLAEIPDSEYERWHRRGFTHIWLMGVWRVGARCREVALAGGFSPNAAEVTGSPYAIAEYRVCPSLGGESGLQEFRRRLHKRGMKLILDFVPNHVGLDHPWTSERPELFVQSPTQTPGTFRQKTKAGVRWLAHGRDPYFPPWTDTVQLDYRNPDTRSTMKAALIGIADRCDGVRCDMAMLVLSDIFAKTWAGFSNVPAANPVPGEFWTEAVASTRQAHPDFLFLAEVYWGLEARLQSFGFNCTYDKELYDDLIRRDFAKVQRHLLEASPQFVQASTHFLENHDEPRIASLLSPAEHRAAAWLILSLPGMRLLHDGQLEGARIKVPVQISRRPSEPAQVDIRGMYEEMLDVLQKTSVGDGEATILKPHETTEGNLTARNFVAIQWQARPPDFDLVLINLAPHRGQCRLHLSIEGLAGCHWTSKDLLGIEERRFTGTELLNSGLHLDLPGTTTQLLHFTPVN